MESTVFVHPSSFVDDGAIVGVGTKIWHFCHVMPKAKIGLQCNIGQNVFIDNNVVLGNGVKVQNNVSVYNGVIVEDGAFLGPSMVFTNVINPRSFIERKNEFRQTLIGKGATIGANATIVCGVTIGAYALIGAGAVITKDIPSYALVVGNPSRQIGWVGQDGNRLVFDEDGNCLETGGNAIYRLRNNKLDREILEN
jgi:UDP-2-acetamido-3-amino-2,3-dideoxy-glucuronate N-acetyltransferase